MNATINRSIGGRDKSFLNFVATVLVSVFTLLVCAGCPSTYDDGGNPITPPSGERDPALILPDGEAWITDDFWENGERGGPIFLANGTGLTVADIGGYWTIVGEGDWTTSNGRINFYNPETGNLVDNIPYSVSSNGNTLTMDGDVFTRTTNVRPNTPSGNVASGNFVLGANEAWVDGWPAGNRDGFIFNANGTVTNINDYTGSWQIAGTGTWSVLSGFLFLDIPGTQWQGDFPYTFSANGNTLTLPGILVGGDDYVLSRTSGVTVGGGNPPPPQTGSIVNGANEAWVDGYSAGNRDGFIFNTNGTVTNINDYTGSWQIAGTGTWSVSGGIMTWNIPGTIWVENSFTYTFSNNGNTVMLGDDYVLTRTSGITVGGNQQSGNLDSRLFNNAAAREAWVSTLGVGFILQSDGGFYVLDKEDETWAIESCGTWHTNNAGEFCMNSDGDVDCWPFSVSGNNAFTMQTGGSFSVFLTRTSGIATSVEIFTPNYCDNPYP